MYHVRLRKSHWKLGLSPGGPCPSGCLVMDGPPTYMERVQRGLIALWIEKYIIPFHNHVKQSPSYLAWGILQAAAPITRAKYFVHDNSQTSTPKNAKIHRKGLQKLCICISPSVWLHWRCFSSWQHNLPDRSNRMNSHYVIRSSYPAACLVGCYSLRTYSKTNNRLPQRLTHPVCPDLAARGPAVGLSLVFVLRHRHGTLQCAPVVFHADA